MSGQAFGLTPMYVAPSAATTADELIRRLRAHEVDHQVIDGQLVTAGWRLGSQHTWPSRNGRLAPSKSAQVQVHATYSQRQAGAFKALGRTTMNIVRQTTQAYRIVWKDTFRIHETSDKSIAVVELSPRVTADSGFLAIVSLLTPVRSQGVPRRHSPTYVPERGTYEATRCDAPSMVSARMVLDRLDYGQVIEHSPIPVKK